MGVQEGVAPVTQNGKQVSLGLACMSKKAVMADEASGSHFIFMGEGGICHAGVRPIAIGPQFV